MPQPLRRTLRVHDVTLFLIVAVVGLRWIATAAAAGPSALVVWLIGFAALFVPLAFAVLELASRHPDEGGLYVWTGRALGRFAGFMSAWMYWASTIIYLPGLLYFAAGNALFIGGPSWQRWSDSPAYFVAVSLGGIALGTALNVVGLEVGKRLHNLGAWSTWLPVAALVLMGLAAWLRFGPATVFTPAALVPSTRLSDISFWATIAFAFGGIEAASFMGEEIEDARRTVPRAVVAAGLAITAVYVLGTAAVLVALPGHEVSGLQGIMQAIQRVADRVGFPALGSVAAALVALGSLAGAAAWLAATARLLFVAGVDRYLPAAFGRLHLRWGTPAAALVAQAIGAALVALLGQAGATVRGAYDVLVSMGVITYFIPFLLLFATLLRVQGQPAPPHTLRVPGGRPMAVLLALLGMATTTVSIGLAAFPPGEPGGRWLAATKVVGGSAFLAALGAVVYWRGRARRTGPALPASRPF